MSLPLAAGGGPAAPRLPWLPKPGRWMGHSCILPGLMMLGFSQPLAGEPARHHLGSTDHLLADGGQRCWRCWIGILALRHARLHWPSPRLIMAAPCCWGALTVKGSGSVDRIALAAPLRAGHRRGTGPAQAGLRGRHRRLVRHLQANKYNVLLQGEVQEALSAPDAGGPARRLEPAERCHRRLPAPARRRRRPLQPDTARFRPEGEKVSPLLDKAELLNVLNKAGLIQPGPISKENAMNLAAPDPVYCPGCRRPERPTAARRPPSPREQEARIKEPILRDSGAEPEDPGRGRRVLGEAERRAAQEAQLGDSSKSNQEVLFNSATSPRLGARNPKPTLVLFTDYNCPTKQFDPQPTRGSSRPIPTIWGW